KIAQDIIDNSIKAAIYIDDKIAFPFKYEKKNINIPLCSEMYESFDKNNTSIKFYKFEGLQKWEKDKKELLPYKDMLILDWKLETNEPRYKNTLPVINRAIHTENIFCIVIYTDTPEREISDIFHNICSYFSSHSINVYDIKPQIDDKLTEWGIAIDFISESLGQLVELVIKPEHARDTLKSIKNNYRKILGSNFSEFEDLLKQFFRTQKLEEVEIYKILGYVYNNCIFPSESIEDIYYEVSDDYLLVNNTYIFIERKIEPKNLYPKIKTAIINSTRNFLPIMGLEMRNIFNESCAIISKKLSSIDDYAFIHHQNNVKPKEAFFEFLTELWKDQSFSFLCCDNKIKIFDELNSYKRDRKITKKILKKKIKTGELDYDLAKLNCFYNLLFSNKKNKEIGFGDIFKLKENDNETNRYILCVTAHCDCMYPKNINNNFYFVEGNKDNLSKGLDQGDEGFNTFIEDESNKEIICIRWKHKPITIYVPDSNNNVNMGISVTIGPKQYTAHYKATLKGNYAQRMANKAFTHPLRVGIFFANKKKKKK
ncbi:MAG: hypothetical protein KAW56_04115, partial [Candidatus Marinimicrobia bacterium]|nr:hypothetical protein [Candidatus Neomarinimicrobiota bacterium]